MTFARAPAGGAKRGVAGVIGVLWLTLAIALLVLPPIAGAYLADKPLAPYLNILPSTLYVVHPAFSWAVFSLLGVLILVCAGPFLYRLYQAPDAEVKRAADKRPMPTWGWVGAALIILCWSLAWADFGASDAGASNGWQRYTFTPLWLGYILLINGLCVRRSGRCLMLDRPKKFLLLFPVSAVFWWFFEYLNQFVHNWYYVGVGDMPASTRIISASLSFATVLPAVLSTIYWMATFQRVHLAYAGYWKLRIPYPRALALAGLLASTASLFGLGRWPDFLYPLVWVSPLIVLLSLQALAGRRTVFSTLEKGDWRPFCLPALAGLQCGLFWELWNYGSTAHWEYSIPYVDRFHLFEMPLLGYAGYFPFGLECVLVASLVGLQVPADLSKFHRNGREFNRTGRS